MDCSSPALPQDPRIRRERRSAYQPRRTTVQVPPYEIHALDAGEGLPAVVFLHGLSGSSRWWYRNVPAFAESRRVLVPDVIGFGRTVCPGPLPSMRGLARILADWIEEIGCHRVDLVGHSMGGHIAVHLAARFPERVRRLVLVDSAGLVSPLTARAVARFASETLPPSRWGDPSFLPTIVRDTLRAGPRSVIGGLSHILRDNVRELLPQITAPTLVLWGEYDSIIPVEHAYEFRLRIARAKLLILPRAAHNPMVDRAADFNDAVLRFLDGEVVGR